MIGGDNSDPIIGSQ